MLGDKDVFAPRLVTCDICGKRHDINISQPMFKNGMIFGVCSFKCYVLACKLGCI